jgi:hypothetical protein
VGRIAPTVLAVALLAATAAAFVRAEQLKLEPGPILQPVVDDVVAPTCACDHRRARVEFSLRRPSTISVAIADDAGNVVRTLISNRRYDRRPVRLEWDGRDARGRVVPDGVYRPRLDLPRRAPLLMPDEITVDTVAPRLRVTGMTRPVISPDGDGRFDGFTIAYALDAPARGLLYVDGRVLQRKRSAEAVDEFPWYGRVQGRRPRPGDFRLSLAAEDEAGNVSKRSRPVRVRVRFVELARTSIAAVARTRFGVGVRSDARRITWRFAGRSGRTRPGLLVLRAPRAGRYTLFVEANGHAARASVVVRAR